MLRMFCLFVALISFYSCKKKESDNIPPPPSVYTQVKLDSSSFLIGNLEKGVMDTFQLYFNKPVQFKYVLLINSGCLPEIKFTATNGGKTVKFYNILCGELSRDYEFEFMVVDSEGKSLKDTVMFSYYTRKLVTEGQIMSYIITSDNKYCWITTSSPHRVYCIGLEDTNYQRKIELSFQPGQIVFNNYNQKLYILNYAHYSTTINNIYVIEPSTGTTEKTITVTHDQYDDPQKHIYVAKLDFCASGFGILTTGTTEYGTGRWRILDSRFNDTIYAHEDWIVSLNTGGIPFGRIYNPQSNFDKTKIYMQRENSAWIGIVMNCINERMIELSFPGQSLCHYIVPSKTMDKLFIAGYYYQGIIGNNAPFGYSQFHNIDSESADFTYRNSQDNVIYYRSWEDRRDFQLMLLDYDNAKTLMRTRIAADFYKINVTTNGKYLLAVARNSIFVFDTEIFYKYV